MVILFMFRRLAFQGKYLHFISSHIKQVTKNNCSPFLTLDLLESCQIPQLRKTLGLSERPLDMSLIISLHINGFVADNISLQ